MIDDGTRSILTRLAELERTATRRRRGVITDADPLSVAVSGSEVPYVGVKAIAGIGRLAVDDVVECLVTQNDLIILGRAGAGGGFQEAGPSGSDSGITSGSLTALTSGPSLTVLEAGEYEVTFGMHMQSTGAGVAGLIGALLVDGVGVGGSPNVSTDRLYTVSTAQFGGGKTETTIVVTLAAGDVLTLGRASQSGVAASFQEGYIAIRPAR